MLTLSVGDLFGKVTKCTPKIANSIFSCYYSVNAPKYIFCTESAGQLDKLTSFSSVRWESGLFKGKGNLFIVSFFMKRSGLSKRDHIK